MRFIAWNSPATPRRLIGHDNYFVGDRVSGVADVADRLVINYDRRFRSISQACSGRIDGATDS